MVWKKVTKNYGYFSRNWKKYPPIKKLKIKNTF